MIKVKILEYNTMFWDNEHISQKLAEEVNQIGKDRILHITSSEADWNRPIKYTIFYEDD